MTRSLFHLEDSKDGMTARGRFNVTYPNRSTGSIDLASVSEVSTSMNSHSPLSESPKVLQATNNYISSKLILDQSPKLHSPKRQTPKPQSPKRASMETTQTLRTLLFAISFLSTLIMHSRIQETSPFAENGSLSLSRK